MIENGIDEDEVLILMRYRLLKLDAELTRQKPWYRSISTRSRHALLNMAYQLDVAGLLVFRPMLAAAGQGDRQTATHETLDSRWAAQTPEWAGRVASLLELG